ncbi:LysM peptidoglycan-binding domain-containing protein [candidate division KSB1 bacterium]|nr:LysM peptidoglycan-binding domain-containing protein [candidate division KSB1 bacterium]
MKKILILFILVTVVFGLYSEENLLWCKKVIFNEPTKHVIQKGDFFSKLSKQYYGTTGYWRELALINRAPNKDLVFPGEEVVIPSLDAMKKLRKTRMLSVVNDIVKDQNDWIAKNGNITTNYAFEEAKHEPKPVGQAAPVQESETITQETAANVSTPSAISFETEPLMQEELEKSSMLPIILTITAIVLVVGLMSLYLYRRKKKYEMEAFEPSAEKEEEITMVDEDEEMDDAYSDPFSTEEHEHEREREGVLVS